RLPVGLFLIFSTLFFFFPILNTVLKATGIDLGGPHVRVDTNARALFPDHPYIHAQDKFAKIFGSSSLVAIAVVVKEGTIFTPERIQKIREITQRLDGIGFDSQTDARDELRDQLEEANYEAEDAGGDAIYTVQQIREILDRRYPPYPVNHNRINSIAHRSTRVIQIEAD
ncbi:MAG: hypothetical protein GWN32_12165, partial [Gemmatimonadetes bacterium]|nr:hypothetical protein [Gemmatimonadota bacterium]